MSAPDDDMGRYLDAGHAVQSGVAMEHELGGTDGSPKHLRTGINMALVGQAAIARLLIDRGIFTEDEYLEALADEAEREVARYEARLSAKTGTRVTLR